MKLFFYTQIAVIAFSLLVALLLCEWWVLAGVALMALLYAQILRIVMRDKEPADYMFGYIVEDKSYKTDFLILPVACLMFIIIGIEHPFFRGGVGTFGLWLILDIVEWIFRKRYVRGEM